MPSVEADNGVDVRHRCWPQFQHVRHQFSFLRSYLHLQRATRPFKDRKSLCRGIGRRFSGWRRPSSTDQSRPLDQDIVSSVAGRDLSFGLPDPLVRSDVLMAALAYYKPGMTLKELVGGLIQFARSDAEGTRKFRANA